MRQRIASKRYLADSIHSEYNLGRMHVQRPNLLAALAQPVAVPRAVLAMAVLLLAACNSSATSSAGGSLIEARRAWAGDWHAVWQIEWSGAPVQGPLVVEVWHRGAGGLRLETLEAPTVALAGLTLVDDGEQVWLYDLRPNRVEHGRRLALRIPLASDALDVWNWLLTDAEQTAIHWRRADKLESGPATQLALTTRSGDQATVWIDDQTGLPAGLDLSSHLWGQVTMVTRSISRAGPLSSALFAFNPPAGAEIVDR
jgi:outer membrane lipoprotein-sorting protein